MDRYEISLWEDFPDVTEGGVPFLNERKLCVIGSHTMHQAAAAFEPKLVNNINGTNTFTFKLYQFYTDEFTGEKHTNPFLKLLINERKVKVLWKDKWYDLVIKDRQEDTSTKVITYVCNDVFITELSRNGYNLEYSVDLQNSTGTANELVENVLKNTGWRYDEDNSTRIIQKVEEPVYEVVTNTSFNATKQSPDGDTTVTIPSNKLILVFYSSVVDTDSNETQFLYAPDGYATNDNDMLVTNGDCYVTDFSFNINTSNGVSSRYRAERLVKSQITEYDELFDRYVNVYTDSQNNNKKVYGYEKSEFSDPMAVVNLLANPSKFTGVDGWIGSELTWGVYPKFTSSSSITTYTGKSYLKVNSGYIYNAGISSNKQYLTPSQADIKNGKIGGFHVNDKYVFRVKVKSNVDGAPGTYLHSDIITPLIKKFNDSYQPTGTNYFSVDELVVNGNWNEFPMTCTKSCPVDELTNLGFFIKATGTCWIEEAEFFRYEVGVTSYDSGAAEHRINPGEIALQSVEKIIYRYYNADHDGVTDVEALKFLYEGESAQDERFVPTMNNYEKIATIEVKESNRFNILQSIAESFKCWVKFIINHNDDGSIIKDEEGLPEKYVALVEYIGNDLGLCFEYGIDLKNLQRKIISNELSTKIIVLPNQNEFAQNGFCTIARSSMNYSGENFILDLGYYTSQGLLDQDMVNKDLYSTSNNYLGYYYNLHRWNKEYDEITTLLAQKNIELTKQESQITVLEAQQKASNEELENCKSDIMTLACVDTWEAAQQYARDHADYTQVQSLMNTIAQIDNTIADNLVLLTNSRASVEKLETYIQDKTDRQKLLIDAIEELHIKFFKKYSRFIQEGTWQDESYINDDKYYLDALDVAYTSSRPQLQYEINVMRLQGLEDFSSKQFNVGDICYIIDREFFGYSTDGITPYKLKIIVSEVTSFFDSPEKDIIKVQNYKTNFDDLFQRITATTQQLQYASGGYTRAAAAINPDKTLSFNLLQNTFDENEDLVLNASNQQVIWDSTGITISDGGNSANKVRILAGGLFISDDGGNSWKNAIRGDGINTNVLTAGRINTGEIYIYDGEYPSFRWDGAGIDAYYFDSINSPSFNKYVRFDRFGLYGYDGGEESSSDFVPSSEDEIWNSEYTKFGLTWKGFFLRTSSDGGSIIISSEEDIVVKDSQNNKRIQIGRLGDDEYGFQLWNSNGESVFVVNNGGANIAGWSMGSDSLYTTTSDGTLGLYAQGVSATIQGETDNYYILAGDSFGVTIDGKVRASAGKIGGWHIDDTTIYSGNKDEYGVYSGPFTEINSNGTLRGSIANSSDFWEISSSGKFNFCSPAVASSSGGEDGSKITLGSTEIDNYSITTGNLQAKNGSIGGVGISSAGLNFGDGGKLIIGGNTVTLHTINSISAIAVNLNSGSTTKNITINFDSAQVTVDPDGVLHGSITTSVSVPTYSLSGSYDYKSYSALTNPGEGHGGGTFGDNSSPTQPTQ